MAKKNKTPLGIFTEAIGLYFSNFDKFFKYMSFPVLGQACGLGLILAMTYLYSKNIPFLMQKYPFFDNFNILVITSVLLTLPGVILMLKALWEYLVAYGAVNSMLENMLKSGKVYDFDAHTELIKRRTVPFLGLWFLFGIFSLLSVIPVFWVPCGVLAVFFVLVFQVFTFEPELSPVGCAKKSMILIHGHFASTFMLMALAGALTYIFLPQVVNSVLETVKVTSVLSVWVSGFVEVLPVDELNRLLAYAYIPPLKVSDISACAVSTFVAQLLIQYTLPLRSVLWGMWYRELNGSFRKTVSEKKKTPKKSVKRPSEKLMEESHKKLDRNILRRAMEKEEN